MSTMPSNGSPPSTRSAITIIPAQVPSIGIPARARSRIGSTNPALFASLPIVVDSPPGITKASTCSRSSGVRTSTGDAPRSARTRPCSRKSPCRARTPTFTRRSPPAGLEQTLLAELLDVDPLHRLAETVRDLGEHVGVVEVRGGLDDRAGSCGGVLGLEDPRSYEDAVHTELHHQRRVGRGGQPISFSIVRWWGRASTALPFPASPFVRIIAAPSAIRRSASPRLRAPHTNGTVNAHLSMWCSSSAGVRTSDSSA